MKKHSVITEILLRGKDIVAISKKLGKQISLDYEGRRPLFIGLLTGCVPFMAELIKYITCEMDMDFMDISSYEGISSVGQITVEKDITLDVEGRDVILVEDIIDTGLTVFYVQELLNKRRAKSIEIVALVNKPDGRKVKDLEIKYLGHNIPDEFVVGFGMDYNGLYRNLPYIGILDPKVYKEGGDDGTEQT